MDLAERYQRFARDYVQMASALIKEGVPEDLARQTARLTATDLLESDLLTAQPGYDPALGPCPTCGRG